MRGRVIIVEIVVGRELLCVGDLVVEPNGELVLAFVLFGTLHGLAGASRRYILLVESHCRWIEALRRNLCSRGTGRYVARRGTDSGAAAAAVADGGGARAAQSVGEGLIGESAAEAGGGRRLHG